MTTKYKRKLLACDGLIMFLAVVPVIVIVAIIGYLIGLLI